ncbi:hypothetical protein [Anaeromyxobacter soli]|uniref:hypothetical protein n=1 Tax=Anaeromyxobacter soli TaxID=2922725 RepID=UPI001FB02773|nr:hypothetical protein [Anaeromyxobacter sp. SG29]
MIVTECPSCHWPVNHLAPDEYRRLPADVRDAVKRDTRRHREVHNRKTRAFAALSYQPRTKQDRKALEQAGENLIGTGASLADKVRGARMYIEALYDRSLDAAAVTCPPKTGRVEA